MNIFDIIICLLLILGFIIGFKNGVVRQGISLAGIIIIFVIAYFLKGFIGNFLCINLPFFNYFGPLKGLTTINIIVYQLIAFLLVFTVLLLIYIVIVKISKVLEKVVDATIIFWLPSKLLGGFLCFIEVYVIIYAVILFLSVPLSTNSYFHNSKGVNIVLYETPFLGKTKFAKSVKNISTLTNDIKKEKISKEAANKKILVILVENNVIDIDTVNKLNEQNKLKIKGLKKY
jgi:uncharacterized membrane protein required for colicin V production